ncbi:glutathione S-transferase [Pseudomonas sp. MWU16-30317]|uniref:glutathione S-transferase family protein n=1 Tax=Pseudomonas sp. MWU16-30317 TaxID=2878095 RepID=UPI001CFB8638|nr:glutathione S-transferase [Pseudomonas sp. MWU16-30317]
MTTGKIIVHHLNNSRSQRILWLLEELGLPYEIKRYQRDAKTNLAPPELKAINPLGKSPVIEDGPHTLIESAAIIDYLIRRHGDGRLQPDPATATYDEYVQWLHFAEGSSMLPLMLNLYVGRLGEAGAPLHPRIRSELANYLGYLDTALGLTPYLVGEEFSGADIQMSFIGEIAKAQGLLAPYPNLTAWVERFQARPAYKKAIEQGGEYSYSK